MTRLVLDTNTVISGMFWRSAPHALLQAAWASKVVLVTSEPLLLELESVLRRRKFAKILAASPLTVVQLVQAYVRLSTVVTPIAIS